MNSVTWITILTSAAAFLGVAFGIAGFILGVLNYVRDQPRIKVRLQWNMTLVGDSFLKDNRECGLVTVTNTGRRPVYISHVCLLVPKNHGHKYRGVVLMDSIPGRKLAEGDPPALFVVPHDVQKECSDKLNRIRARVEDSERVYISKYPKSQETCRWFETK